MPDSRHISRPFRIASVIASLTAGGIGPVCRYAAEGMAKLTDWQVTLLSLHDPVGEVVDEASGLRIVSLGLDGNCARLFLQWLTANPQDMMITSDVSRIEPAYRFIPPTTRHVMQIHDSGWRYRQVVVRHAACVDGVTCVGQHIKSQLQRELNAVGFQGLLRTVHNGANFPPLPSVSNASAVSCPSPVVRPPSSAPLRLLFMGRVEPLKGVLDFVPLLNRLKKLCVPVNLNIVGGENEALRHQFQRKGLSGMVTWTGRVPHEQCYRIAAESDLLLMPTRKESFGMVTIEAMSMGCVPMAYDIPSGSTEIIEHGKSGLLVPLGDICHLAEQIQSLHHDRKRLAQLSVGAIQHARGVFNAETMSANMVAFLKDVMTHAEEHPAERESGLPLETPAIYAQPTSGYQSLPAGWRDWIRNQVGAHPRLCQWWLNR